MNEFGAKSGKAFVVQWSAIWCGPCKALSPILAELAAKHSDKFDLIKIDIEKERELSKKYDIRSIPILFLYDSTHTLVGTVSGFSGRESLEKSLQKILG